MDTQKSSTSLSYCECNMVVGAEGVLELGTRTLRWEQQVPTAPCQSPKFIPLRQQCRLAARSPVGGLGPTEVLQLKLCCQHPPLRKVPTRRRAAGSKKLWGWSYFRQRAELERQIKPDLYTREWRRKWRPTPVFFPGKPHGQRSLVGYSPWAPRRVGTTD